MASGYAKNLSDIVALALDRAFGVYNVDGATYDPVGQQAEGGVSGEIRQEMDSRLGPSCEVELASPERDQLYNVYSQAGVATGTEVLQELESADCRYMVVHLNPEYTAAGVDHAAASLKNFEVAMRRTAMNLPHVAHNFKAWLLTEFGILGALAVELAKGTMLEASYPLQDGAPGAIASLGRKEDFSGRSQAFPFAFEISASETRACPIAQEARVFADVLLP